MKKMKKILALAVWIAALGLLCASCDNGLDIQQAYTFSLETMPVQKRISVGETAEIRCTLVREGRYDGARYTIRYFQPDGRGELRMDDGTVFLPNDRYPLDREVFRLYYTSRSDDQQAIDVYVEDNTGQDVKSSCRFSCATGGGGRFCFQSVRRSRQDPDGNQYVWKNYSTSSVRAKPM